MSEIEYFAFTGLGWLLAIGVYFIPGFLILRKIGYSGWWVLALLIPYVILVLPWILALAKWPIEGELERARTRILADARQRRREQEVVEKLSESAT
jgi:hypothetical protein